MIESRVNRGGFDEPKNVTFWPSAVWCGYWPRETGNSERAKPRGVTRSGNPGQLLLPIARHPGCSVCFLMRDEDAEALNELVLERRRLIRRLDELNDLLLEVDLRTIEPALRKGSITIH